ncbi:lipoprotein releasing system, transmembrane protein, LolC/E family [Legionella busanensis]|uniref:Lipoprotein releasing system, transmembrane protein, LolC/E family n=1 Tax=Legionella busanensis TaxID=190655 RepID=A0A378JFQ8_9GAMM|nr:FtsX-like permease family protein [Legionella busanensis]STX50015.1 lipoprotein releasing system, transmembrane protein, LolC/E family [Legionella busanensis]
MLNFPLILRTFVREWRSGELSLLFLALLIAVTCMSSINNITSSIENLVNQQASQMLGADVSITSNSPIPKNWERKAKALQLVTTQTISFFSMAMTNDKLQLVQVKAITSPYPLKGAIKVAPQPFALATRVNHAPELGQLWAEAKLLSLLSAKIGDKITIGEATFIISSVLIEEPGQTGDWFNISPRVIINQGDLAKTKVIQTGSKVNYNWLLIGSENQLTKLKNSLNPPLSEQQNWQDKTTNPTLIKAIERTLAYLNLGILMSLILAGIAISMAMQRYNQRHQKNISILRCFGATEKDIFLIYLGIILILGCFASLIGILLSYLFQPFLFNWLKGLLPDFQGGYSFKPALLSFSTGILILLSFTLPHLLSLRKISAITLFKSQYQINKYSFLNYFITSLVLFGLAFLYIRSWQLILIVFIGLIYFAIFALSLILISNFFINFIKNKISFIWRFGFTSISRNLTNSLLQLIGIGLALAALLTLNLFKTNLVENWQQQLPANAANFFVINIQPTQTSNFLDFLKQNQVKNAILYPIVKGRLITIDDTQVSLKLGAKANDINALQRELNLSWSKQLPEENKIVQGSWQTNQSTWLSIEEGLARQLDVHVGDKLGFRIGEQTINAPITSIRQVNWTSFKPNFFILFSPSLLANLPKSYLTSFYLPEEKQHLLVNLVRQFPGITIIDIANTIKKVQTIFRNISKAINLITIFSFLIGIIIAILAMLAFNDIKQQEIYVLKLLGIQKKALFWIRSSEAAIIGFYAGLLAIILAIVINYYFNTIALNFTFNPPWVLLILVPMLTSLANILINYKIAQFQDKGLD